MSKHLVYLGYTGTMHRIALFDTNNILVGKVPVKDVPVLSDDLQFLNCTVINGKPIPNLQGVKVLCSVPKGQPSTYGYRKFRQGEFKSEVLWAFPNKKPKYLYNCDTKYTEFGVDEILREFSEFNIWDGMCKEDNFYVIGPVMVYKSSKRNVPGLHNLYMTYDGCLFFAYGTHLTTLTRAGAVFVQVSTPELTYPQSYDYAGLVSYPCVGITKEDEAKYIGYKQKTWNDETVKQQAEFVWWTPSPITVICDLRGYTKARVFGIGSSVNARAVIFPESTEQIWLGMLQSTSLRAVYIPSSVANLHEVGMPKRLKNTTFYSNSPVVANFCKKYGVPYKPCATADEMLEQFYSVSDAEHLSVSDASNIAALAGSESDKAGETGTLWSAIRFSCMVKGTAYETLRERYPIVRTCDYEAPVGKTHHFSSGEADSSTELNKERCRTFIASLTHFYPLFDAEMFKDWCESDSFSPLYTFKLGTHTLYIAVGALSYEQNKGAMYDRRHIVWVVDVKSGRAIHRFICNTLFTKALLSLEFACVANREPCGVLRYADKLPEIYNSVNQYVKDKDRDHFVSELLTTLIPIKYDTRTSKRMLVGIDLHTGNFCSFEYTPAIYRNENHWAQQPVTPIHQLEYVRQIKNIKEYPADTDLSSLFPKDCVYSKRGETI